MVSILSMLALQAHAVNLGPGANIQASVAAQCLNPDGPNGEAVIELQTDQQAVWVIGPAAVNGDLIQYPPAGCNNAPPLIIRGSDVPAVIRYAVQANKTSVNMMTFSDGANVTLENLTLEGRLTSETLDDNGDLDLPLCASNGIPDGFIGGDLVRGVYHIGDGLVPSTVGSLTVENSTFRCLDGDSDAVFGNRQGGAILAQGVPVSVNNSVFEANRAFQGGAVAVTNGNTSIGPATTNSTAIFNSSFLANYAEFGGAISDTLGGHAVEIELTQFDLNVGTFGAGAVLLSNTGDVRIRATNVNRQNFDNFDEFQQGGAFFIENATAVTFQENIFCGAWAGEGGGLYMNNPGPAVVQNNVFAENGAICYGGGLYVDESASPQNDLRVINNTFVGNEAGRYPPFLNIPEICTFGGGGAAWFNGVNPEFRNNVVAFSSFGGGVAVKYVPYRSLPAFQIGDEFQFYNNNFFSNNDSVTSSAGHFTADLASIAVHPSNLMDIDPQLVYNGVGEYNCVPDAFYPQRTSPLVDAGGGPPVGGIPGDCVDRVDTNPVPDFEHDSDLRDDFACDIGAFGGDFGLFAKDTDDDGVQNIFDCDDNNSTVSPLEPTDACDFIDNDCDGEVDEDFEVQWWPDADGDGFGDPSVPQELSCEPVTGKVNNRLDCNDSDPAINPSAPEICNGLDDDCSGAEDDNLDFQEFFLDLDGDGFGSSRTEACQSPPPPSTGGVYVLAGGDCNETNPAISPGAREVCNGVDDDCDSLIDASDPDTEGVAVYRPDEDGDGYGPAEAELRACDSLIPDGFVEITDANAASDCDDLDPNVNPGMLELCLNKDVDENCDGQVDEVGFSTGDVAIYYTDADGDGLGDNLLSTPYCPDDPNIPPNLVLVAGDCDDSDPLVGECTSCGCQATPSPIQGGVMLLIGALGVLARRRR